MNQEIAEARRKKYSRGSGWEPESQEWMSDNVYDETEVDSGDSMRTAKLTSDLVSNQQQSAPSSDSGATSDMAGKTLTGAGISSGNPYAVGAGLGLQVLSMNQRRKQADAEAKYRAKLDQVNRTQNALNNLIQVSSNLRL